MASIPGNEGGITQCARRYASVFGVLLALGGTDPRNEAILEAVLKRARAIKHPWLVACDANMSPVEFEKKKTSGFRRTGCMW